MTIEELMELQEAGSRACILGLKVYDNPYLKPERLPSEDAIAPGDWVAGHDAWKFGWKAEQASREGRVAQYFRDLLQPPSRSSRNEIPSPAT